MRRFRNKKIAFALAILFSIAIGFWLNTEILQAAPASSGFGKGFTAGAAKVGDVAATVLMVYGILALLGSVLHGILGILGFFLDNVSSWNLLTNPSQMEIVQIGWTVMRDLTNGIFILVVLWIAITIIFNLDNLGGKRLLIRVIVIALLINFSLAMVSAVFGFTNVLAKPFYTAIGLKLDDPKSGLSGILIGHSAIHEISDIARAGAVEEFRQALAAQARAPQVEESQLAWLWHSLGAPQEAQARDPLTMLQMLGVGTRVFAVQTAGAVAGGLVTGAVTTAVAGLFGVTWQGVVNQFISDGFLLLMAVALFTATLIFMLRLAAMVFLGIFAPIAFIGHIIPKYGDRFWNQWLEYLFNWAFVAPVFYFLLYITLLMLDVSRSAGPGGLQALPLSSNALKMLNLAIFLVLFFTTIRITRKMGGAVAETALNISKKMAGVGLGLAAGGLAFGAGALARRAAPTLKKAIDLPILRQTTFARRTGAYLEKQQDKIAPHVAELKGYSDEYLVQEYDRSVRAERKVAIANLLVKRGKGDLLGGRQDQALKLATQFGAPSALEILKANPALVTKEILARIGITKDINNDEDAKRNIIKRIKEADAGNLSDDVFKDKDTMKLMWETFRPEEIRRIATAKSAMMTEMMKTLNENPDINITPEVYQYLGSNSAQMYGLQLPPNLKKPRGEVERDIRVAEKDLATQRERINDLHERADVLRSRGRTDEADNVLKQADEIVETQMPIIEQKIRRMKQELDALDARARASQQTTPSAGGGTPAGGGGTATPPGQTPPSAGTAGLPPRGKMEAKDVPPRWVDDAKYLIRQGGGSPEQKTIMSAGISEPEKDDRLREELARGYNQGKY